MARFAQRTRSLGVPAAGTGTRSWAVTVVTVCPPPAVGELRTDAAGVEAADSARVVKRLCEVLQIARSSFYAWLDGEPRRAERAILPQPKTPSQDREGAFSLVGDTGIEPVTSSSV